MSLGCGFNLSGLRYSLRKPRYSTTAARRPTQKRLNRAGWGSRFAGCHAPAAPVVSGGHRGVLFLDELPEFGAHRLEGLRQPLEDGEVSIARSTGTLVFPAHFMFISAMNPCPCGYYVVGEHRSELC